VIARLPRTFTIALILGLGISQLLLALADWHLSDANAYWNAAQRLRSGQELYPTLQNVEASDVYRYAPWFAWAWIPLTHLPKGLAFGLWSIVLLGASGAALWPLIQRRAWLAVAFFLPILVGISGIGNVQPLIVAALVLGLQHRTGPLWIAVAASLKAIPILFVITYLGRGQWMRAAASVALTGTLVAPLLMHDLSDYPTSASAAAFLIQWPMLYGVAIAAGIAISLRTAATRAGWLASATTVAVALPRFFVYDVTFLMAGINDRGAGSLDGRDDRAIEPSATRT
jgi:hypothetical protein